MVLNKLIINLDNKEKTIIPYEHQYFIHAYILSELKKFNEKLASQLYHSKIPYYVMSQLIPSNKAIFNTQGFICDKLVFFITSSDLSLLQFIKFIFEQNKIIQIKNLKLKVYSSYIIEQKVDAIIPEIVTRSPIILKENGRYIAYGDKNFPQILLKHIEKKYSKIMNKNIKIRAINIIFGKRKLYHIHNSPINSSIIKFMIDTDPEVIESMLCFGIGKNTQLGFGMVDIND